MLARLPASYRGPALPAGSRFIGLRVLINGKFRPEGLTHSSRLSIGETGRNTSRTSENTYDGWWPADNLDALEVGGYFPIFAWRYPAPVISRCGARIRWNSNLGYLPLSPLDAARDRTTGKVGIYFTDFFGVDRATLETYGAFNVSLVNDLPLFIDPFLLFDSPKPEYQLLHAEIIDYLKFLRDVSAAGNLTKAHVDQWFRFAEVKQNWLGFSRSGNSGNGLGERFAATLHRNLHLVFRDFGS